MKALIPDGTQVVLPTSVRASDVQSVEVHAKPPRQDIVWQWNFARMRLMHCPWDLWP